MICTGYRVVFDPNLEKPRLERETFSGGVNESARERNVVRRQETSLAYVVHGERLIVVPKHLRAEFEKAMAEVPHG